jgi:hypothetical protein
LEIGCFKGATLWAWKQICDEVYGITLPVKGLKNHGAHVLMEDSHSDEAVSWIENKLFDRELDMLFIDGDHSYDGVRNDWEMYSPYVRKGGLVIFHDIANWMNQPEVVWFWKDLSKGYVICDAEGSVMSLGFGIVEMGERD